MEPTPPEPLTCPTCDAPSVLPYQTSHERPTVTDTPLDLAHAATEAAPQDDAARLRFYERLADGELFLLLEAEPTDTNLKEGKALFTRFCENCHGQAGDGKGHLFMNQ